MKKDIHPQYYPKAKVVCACGNSFVTGATQETIQVEICSACHPFYTGKEKTFDRVGQVQKFKQRIDKGKGIAQKSKATSASKTAAKKDAKTKPAAKPAAKKPARPGPARPGSAKTGQPGKKPARPGSAKK